MKVTDEILKAMQKGVEHIGSKNAFAQRANVSINTVTKYLTRKTHTINDDTWAKIQPVLLPFLNNKDHHNRQRMEEFKKTLDMTDISSNGKILLDAFAELTDEQQERKLIEIVEIARENLKKRNEEAGKVQ
ncbi:MAG: hypothetical protein PHQ27_04795 [Victivallales bacterium]|nr:hypothetical protein [Victivallales bacterium]